jgi:hypothetical protein
VQETVIAESVTQMGARLARSARLKTLHMKYEGHEGP